MSEEPDIEKIEKEIIEEKTLIKDTKEQIINDSKDNDDGLVINDIPQKFNDDGMMEQTCNKSSVILTKIIDLLKQEKVGEVSINRVLKSEQQNDENKFPVIFFAGEEITIKYKIMPVDKFGNDGKQWLTKEEYDLIVKKIEEEKC